MCKRLSVLQHVSIYLFVCWIVSTLVGEESGREIVLVAGEEERRDLVGIVKRRAVKTIIGEDMIVRNENLRRGEEVRRSDLATGKTDSSLVLSSLAFSSPQKILSSACRPMSNLSNVSLTAPMRGEVDRDLKIISSTAFFLQISITVIFLSFRYCKQKAFI